MFLLGKRISSIFKAINSISITLIALIFIFVCFDIYSDGIKSSSLNIYNVEAISNRISVLLPYLALLFIFIAISTITLSITYEKPHFKYVLSNKSKLILAKKKFENLPYKALYEEKKRIYINVASISILMVFLCYSIIYILNKNNFVSWDLEAVMSNLIINILPEIILSFIVLLIRDSMLDKSYERETSILKNETKSNTLVSNDEIEKNYSIIQIFVIIFSILLIAAGIFNGGLKDVLIKAINICTECIGLG